MEPIAIEVQDVEAIAERLRKAGIHFRSDIIIGVGGKQEILDDPSGNPVELFQPMIPEAPAYLELLRRARMAKKSWLVTLASVLLFTY